MGRRWEFAGAMRHLRRTDREYHENLVAHWKRENEFIRAATIAMPAYGRFGGRVEYRGEWGRMTAEAEWEEWRKEGAVEGWWIAARALRWYRRACGEIDGGEGRQEERLAAWKGKREWRYMGRSRGI